MPNTREIRIFRYDPAQPDEGHYGRFELEIENEEATTILDVLLRLQREQDSTLAFRFACRVNMCGSCGIVINGKERLSCKTNVSSFPKNAEITLRPMNHFPVIRDLVVDMEPFFGKYNELLPFYEPKQDFQEPALIPPGSQERREIGMGTECIACGCCVSSCTMVYHHEGYAGPAALNRVRGWVQVAGEAAVDKTRPAADKRKPTGTKAAGIKEAIDINRASATELQRLPGVGPKMAQRILDERQKAPFKSVSELRRVSGIGPKILERLRPYVTVDGEAERIAAADKS